MPALLAVIPHPDDEAYSFGGTMALAARAGWRCHVLCASAGERGERHDGGLRTRLAVSRARRTELRRSCFVLGAEPPLVWGLPDGGLAGAQDQAARLAAVIETLKPDLVLALGPDGAYGHPDHLAVYRWIVKAWESLPRPGPAVLFAAFPPRLFLPQYQKCFTGGLFGVPPVLRPGDIGTAAAHYEVSIASVREQKLAAIAAHRSQLPRGEPEALFPPGIVRALLETERFTDGRGARDHAAAALLATLR